MQCPPGSIGSCRVEIHNRKVGKEIPICAQQWGNSWQDVNSFVQLFGDIRRAMNTTNIIEGLNRQYRMVTKRKNLFPSDSLLDKTLYRDCRNVIRSGVRDIRIGIRFLTS